MEVKTRQILAPHKMEVKTRQMLAQHKMEVLRSPLTCWLLLPVVLPAPLLTHLPVLPALLLTDQPVTLLPLLKAH